MDAVKIGREKLRLEEQLQKEIAIQKDLRYKLVSADDNMQHTTRLLNLLQSFPDEYFERYKIDLANIESLEKANGF